LVSELRARILKLLAVLSVKGAFKNYFAKVRSKRINLEDNKHAQEINVSHLPV
jgi:hypothetical protein